MKPRGGNGQGQSGFSSVFYNFLIKNPMASSDEVSEYIKTQPDRKEGSDVSANVVKHVSHYRGIANLVKSIAIQYQGDTSVK